MKRYAVSPVTDLDVKKVKKYLITKWMPKGKYGAFYIDDDVGYSLYCLINSGCAHIDGRKWTIIEEEEPSDDN